MQKIPVGIQDFRELREGNYLYIDKTKLIAQMPELGKYIFFARPRRFGKSLMLSTLKELYLGNKELFKGLWAYNNWKWGNFPVIYIDLNDINLRQSTLEEGLHRQIQNIAKTNNININSASAADAFRELLLLLGDKNNKCVVLIDEYDKPITDFLNEEVQQLQHINELKAFYSVLKSKDAYIHQAIVTGVSKYGKVSIFSDLNNLLDISTNKLFNDICGYTEQELRDNFDDRICLLSDTLECEKEELYVKIKHWYNGYSWNGKDTVYNPFSILSFFANETFDNFWFETGTPTFLTHLVKKQEILPFEMDNIEGEDTIIESADVHNIGIISLLYQTGYLTIKKILRPTIDRKSYVLGFPNEEVRLSFQRHLLAEYLNLPADIASVNYTTKLRKCMSEGDWNYFFEIVDSLLENIPNTLFDKKEKYFHSVIHVLLASTGLMTFSEVQTRQGRMDTVLVNTKQVFIFEFKMDKTALDAIKQIKEAGYPKRFSQANLQMLLIGVSFDSDKRSVNEWLVEEIMA